MHRSSTELLDRIQRDAFRYFERLAHPGHGLIPDTSRKESDVSIAAVGFALACYPVGVERGFLSRDDAVERTLAPLRFLAGSAQSEAPDATGHKGFYYHFLDLRTGARARGSELSLVDSGILLAGALTAAQYFDRSCERERDVRAIACALFERADWTWALNAGKTLAHGWKPESGFLHYGWEGYSEAMLLYALALGSPTASLSRDPYDAWTGTYQWENLYGQDLLYAGPLFIHQFSHAWIDFRGIRDAFMREKGSDYFENSRRAVSVQAQYAIHNPMAWRGYGPRGWGLSASNGPGPATLRVRDIERRFFDYAARGVPYGPDDGTLSPSAVAASVAFAPEIVLPTLEQVLHDFPEVHGELGLKCVNPSYAPGGSGGRSAWVSDAHFAIDEGPVVLMIENYRSGLLWQIMRECPGLGDGLRRAGFEGGWLGNRGA